MAPAEKTREDDAFGRDVPIPACARLLIAFLPYLSYASIKLRSLCTAASAAVAAVLPCAESPLSFDLKEPVLQNIMPAMPRPLRGVASF